MRLYLPGSPGEDQATTKWQLQLRGYEVTCTMDIQAKAYGHMNPRMTFEKHFQHLQVHEMLSVDAVVADAGLCDNYAIQLLTICGFMGVRLIAIEDLPTIAPDRELSAELDLCTSPPRICNWWERRTGKPPVRQYPIPDQKPPTT